MSVFKVTLANNATTANATSAKSEWFINNVLAATDNLGLSATINQKTLTVANGDSVRCVISFSLNGVTLTAEAQITAIVAPSLILQAPIISMLEQVG